MNASTLSLDALLKNENTLMAGFVTFLLEEQDALKVGDTAAIEALSKTKIGLIGELNVAGERRNRFLSHNGLGPDKIGVEAWMVLHPGDQAVQQQWGILKKTVGEAKELNLLNGQLIAMRMQHNQQALSALLSTSVTTQNNLYGPDGQPTQLSGRRIIDAA